MEESNTPSWLAVWQMFADHYLQPLATDIKQLNASYLVWASPYNVGNITRFPRSAILPPRLMGDLWEQMLQVIVPLRKPLATYP